jgi:hypothetical protein
MSNPTMQGNPCPKQSKKVGSLGPRIPCRCPNRNVCEHTISWDGYNDLCDSTGWIFCDWAKKESKKFEKKPRDWALVKAIGDPEADVKYSH